MSSLFDLVRPLFQRAVERPAPQPSETPEAVVNVEIPAFVRSHFPRQRRAQGHARERAAADLEAARVQLGTETPLPTRMQALQTIIRNTERALATQASGDNEDALLAERDAAVAAFIASWLQTRDATVLPDVVAALIPGPFVDQRLHEVFALAFAAQPTLPGLAELVERATVPTRERLVLMRLAAQPRSSESIAALEPLLRHPLLSVALQAAEQLVGALIQLKLDEKRPALMIAGLELLTSVAHPSAADCQRLAELYFARGDRVRAQRAAEQCGIAIAASATPGDVEVAGVFDAGAALHLIAFCTCNALSLDPAPIVAAAERAHSFQLISLAGMFDRAGETLAHAALLRMCENFDALAPLTRLIAYAETLRVQHRSETLLLKLFDKMEVTIAYAPRQLITKSVDNDGDLSRAPIAAVVSLLQTPGVLAQDEARRRIQRVFDAANALAPLKNLGVVLTLALLEPRAQWPVIAPLAPVS